MTEKSNRTNEHPMTADDFIDMALWSVAQGEDRKYTSISLAWQLRGKGFSLEEALIIGRSTYVPRCRYVTGETSPYTNAEWEEAARVAYSETPPAEWPDGKADSFSRSQAMPPPKPVENRNRNERRRSEREQAQGRTTDAVEKIAGALEVLCEPGSQVVPHEIVEELAHCRVLARQNLDLTLAHLPAELKALPQPQWIVWAFAARQNKSGEWKITKEPYIAQGDKPRLAASNRANEWRTLQVALTVLKQDWARKNGGFYDGLGFMFQGSGYSGADFDHIINGDLVTAPWASKLLPEFAATYVERSVRWEGVHAIVLGICTGGGISQKFNDGTGFELYHTGRFFAVTGQPYNGAVSVIAPYDVQSLHDRFRRGEIGPDDFRAEQSAKAQKRSTAPKRVIDVAAFIQRYQIPTNGTNAEANFTRYSVKCPGCSAKDAYILQHNDGGASMGCYHDSCPFSNKRGDHWNEFSQLWESGQRAQENRAKTNGNDVSEAAQSSHITENQLPGAIRDLALQRGVAAFDKRRSIALLVQDHLTSTGECFHTPDARGFFFHKAEHRIYDTDSEAFERFVAAASGLSLTETFFQFAIDQIRTQVLRNSRLSAVHTLAHYTPESEIIAVSDGASGIWMREKGGEWQERHNGDDGIFFAVDDDAARWRPEFDGTQQLRWFLDQLLFAKHEISIKDSKTLVLVWLIQQFFPELRRTRLVPCFLGPQGSGKSTAARLIGRLIVGPQFDVTGIRRDKEDAFVAAVTNRVVLGLDNADSRIPWLPDALATYATGQRYRLRKLYSTNQELAYTPRSILLISSRDPRFNRADVVERLLPLHFERPALYRTEPEIFSELERRRGAIMGALLAKLGKIADALPTSKPRSLSFRMADFASFGERIFRASGTSSKFLDLLGRLEKVQARFAAEDDGLVEALRFLLEQGPIEDIGVGDLFKKCRQIAEENGLLIADRAQSFGRHLTTMRRVIEIELQVRFLEREGHAGSRRVSLVPAVVITPTPGEEAAEDLHGIN